MNASRHAPSSLALESWAWLGASELWAWLNLDDTSMRSTLECTGVESYTGTG